MTSISSFSLAPISVPVCHCPNNSSRPVLPLPASSLLTGKPARISSSGVLGAPEVLESGAGSAALEDEATSTSTLSVGANSNKMAPKQKIHVKLRSYWVPLIEDSCKQIMDAARTSNAKTMVLMPLPTKKIIYCVISTRPQRCKVPF